MDFAALEVFGDVPNRPSMANFDRNGSFVVSFFGKGDGLLPGRYRVRIQCWKHDPEPVPSGEEAATHIAAGYEPPELVVKQQARSIEGLHYDVPLRKGKNN